MSEEALKWGQLTVFNGWCTLGPGIDVQERRQVEEHPPGENGFFWVLSSFQRIIIPKKPFLRLFYYIFNLGNVSGNSFFLCSLPNHNKRSVFWQLKKLYFGCYEFHIRQFGWVTNQESEILQSSRKTTRSKNSGISFSSFTQHLANLILLCLSKALISLCGCNLYGFCFNYCFKNFHIMICRRPL